jgi:hypothetical protein
MLIDGCIVCGCSSEVQMLNYFLNTNLFYENRSVVYYNGVCQYCMPLLNMVVSEGSGPL